MLSLVACSLAAAHVKPAMITDIWAATLEQVSGGGSTYHWEAYDSKSLNQSIGVMVEKNVYRRRDSNPGH